LDAQDRRDQDAIVMIAATSELRVSGHDP